MNVEVSKEMKEVEARLAAEIEAERKLYSRAVDIGQSGEVNLTLTARDWRLFEDMENVELVAGALNANIAEHINDGYVGAELMRRCHAVCEQYAQFGAGDSDVSYRLCKLLVHVKGDPEYRRFERHYSDYIRGWRQIGQVKVDDGFLWIGDPDDSPSSPNPMRSSNESSPVQLQKHGNGLAIVMQPHWGGEFRVEGLYPRRYGGRLVEIRVVLS